MNNYTLYYDKTCPFCDKYTQFNVIRSCINLKLVDGNTNNNYLKINPKLNFQEGIILVNENSNEIIQGHLVLVELESICKQKSLLLSFQKFIFQNKYIGSFIYNLINSIRKLIITKKQK